MEKNLFLKSAKTTNDRPCKLKLEVNAEYHPSRKVNCIMVTSAFLIIYSGRIKVMGYCLSLHIIFH